MSKNKVDEEVNQISQQVIEKAVNLVDDISTEARLKPDGEENIFVFEVVVSMLVILMENCVEKDHRVAALDSIFRTVKNNLTRCSVNANLIKVDSWKKS